jgi:hypothetical protein
VKDEHQIPNASSLTDEFGEKVHSVAYTAQFIILDLGLRFLFHWLFLLNCIHPIIFWLMQLLFIPLLIVMTVLLLGREAKWENKIRSENNLSDNEKIRIEVKITPIAALIGFLAFVVGLYISWQLFALYFSYWPTFLLTLLTFVFYGFYIIFVTEVSYAAIKKEQLIKSSEKDELEDVDKNDYELARAEVFVNGLAQKIDTLTLESAVLGALAFTCFLTILGIDYKLPADAKVLFAELQELFVLILKFEFKDFNALIKSLPLYTTDNILVIMAVESLVCSLLYLLVIVSRTSFPNYFQEILVDLQLAQGYNQKEEEYDVLLRQGSENTEIKNRKNQLLVLTKKYTDKVSTDIKILKNIFSYMNVIRNTALFLFVVLIATTACIVSVYLGLIFILMYFLSYIFQYYDKIKLNKILYSLRNRM